MNEESRQRFYNNALNDLKERLSAEAGATSSEITLIDQLLEIYRALQKRRTSHSVENEPGMHHSPPLRKSFSKQKMWPSISPKKEFARILSNIESQHPVRVENSNEDSLSPDSEIAFEIHINGKEQGLSRATQPSKQVSQNVTIPPSSYVEEGKTRGKQPLLHGGIVELAKRPQWNRLPALAVQCLQEVTPRSVFTGPPNHIKQATPMRSRSPLTFEQAQALENLHSYE